MMKTMDIDIDTVEVNAFALPLESDKARCFIIGQKKIWVPRSLIYNFERGVLEIPAWLADKNNLKLKP